MIASEPQDRLKGISLRRVWHLYCDGADTPVLYNQLADLHVHHFDRVAELIDRHKNGHKDLDDRPLYGKRLRILRYVVESVTYGLVYEYLPVIHLKDATYTEQPVVCLGLYVSTRHAVPTLLIVKAIYRSRRWAARWR